MRDRRGRVYTPAIGPRLRPLLWIILIGFAVLGANGFYLASVTALTWYLGTTQQTFFYMLMVAPAPAAGLPADRAVRGLRLRAPGDLVEAAQPGGGPLRAGAAGGGDRHPGLGPGPGPDRRASRSATRGSASVGYWLHVVAPLAAIALYVKHRLAGPMIRWHWARRFGVAVVGFVVADGPPPLAGPAVVRRQGAEGGQAVLLSRPRPITANGKFIPAETLMMDDYCLKCHKDAYDGWFHSAHHFSSFNNKAYLFSVRETRKVALERDGNTQAARWCAGCHDPVPFFSGEFDDPNYDDVNNPTSQAGHHLHGLPRDHQRQQHPRQRGLHDRGARALSLRLQRQPGPAVDQPHAGEGQARDAQEDVPQAGHQGRQVLLDLPQGRPALRPEPLQGLRPRPEPLRPVPALGRLGPRGPELLLSRRWPSRTAPSATWS